MFGIAFQQIHAVKPFLFYLFLVLCCGHLSVLDGLFSLENFALAEVALVLVACYGVASLVELALILPLNPRLFP